MSMRILDSVYLKAGLISLILVMPFTSLGGGGNPTIGPITFDSVFPTCSLLGGTHGSNTRANIPMSLKVNEFAILVSQSTNIAGSGTISSIASLFNSDVPFTRLFQSFSGIGDLEIWTAFASANSTQTTVLDYNQSATACVFVGTYLNVAKIGATNIVKGTSDLFNQTITTTTSGSWIIGATGVSTNPQAPQLTPAGSGLISRIHVNSILQHFVGSDLEDVNATQLINGYPFFYQSKENNINPFNTAYSQATLELTPTLPEPKTTCIAPQAAVASPCTPQCTNNVPFIMQCGSISINVPIGSTSGQGSFTFNPAFANTPRPSVTLVGPAQFTIQEPLMEGSPTFLSVESAGQTWSGVPAATTEVFGDAFHRIIYQQTQNPFQTVTSATFSVSCSSMISITGTEFLRPQWYDNSIGAWESVASTVTGLDFNWGAGSLCPYVLGTNTNASPVNASLPKNGFNVIPLRIVGGNGDGITSTITIQQMTLQFFGVISMRPTCSVFAISRTAITLSVDYPFPILINPPTIPCVWEAFRT